MVTDNPNIRSCAECGLKIVPTQDAVWIDPETGEAEGDTLPYHPGCAPPQYPEDPEDYNLPAHPACGCGEGMNVESSEIRGDSVIFIFDCDSCSRQLGIQVEKDGSEIRHLERM